MQTITKQLTRFYRALNHQQVIDLIEENIDLKNYEVLQDKYYRILIPKETKYPIPLLTAHSDTVHEHIPQKIELCKGKLICGDKRIGLGGDDRNGCYLLSRMLQKRPKDFIFALFDLEEGGCAGSMSFDTSLIEDKISLIIGLDRHGNRDLALYGFESDELITILESIEDYNIAFGTMTDAAILAERSGICCFNISVGFYRQHTAAEYTRVEDILKAERLLLDLPAIFWQKQFPAEIMEDIYRFDESLLLEEWGGRGWRP